MKIKYILDSENEEDMYFYERVKQIDAIYLALSDFQDYLRTNTKWHTEQSELNLDTMEKVREEFYRVMQDHYINLEV